VLPLAQPELIRMSPSRAYLIAVLAGALKSELTHSSKSQS